MGKKTLPFVRLKIQVSMKVAPKTETTNGATIGQANSVPIKGKCQSAQIGARIRLARKGECLAWNLGSAKPRQPGSSPSPMKSRMKIKRSGISRMLSRERDAILACGIKPRVSATARRQSKTGVRKVTPYH